MRVRVPICGGGAKENGRRVQVLLRCRKREDAMRALFPHSAPCTETSQGLKGSARRKGGDFFTHTRTRTNIHTHTHTIEDQTSLSDWRGSLTPTEGQTSLSHAQTSHGLPIAESAPSSLTGVAGEGDCCWGGNTLGRFTESGMATGARGGLVGAFRICVCKWVWVCWYLSLSQVELM